jgi:4-carboxymuconolactone decarboxylase
MTDNDRRAKGLSTIKEVYGDWITEHLPPAGKSRYIDFMLETLFGELWASDVLSFRDRRLLLLGAIAAQGEEAVFRIQAAAALKRGELDAEQLQEAILFLTQYVGYPRGSKLHTALGDVLKKS